jgi:DNA-binding NtrC family response regulator
MAVNPARYIIAHETMDAMMSYDWPGNIRELKNCLERMITLSSDPILRFADLPIGVIYHARAENPAEATAAVVGMAGAATHGVIPLQEVERRAIRHALAQTHGDRTEAAHLLGIGRTTLYRKLKEYRMP